MADLVYVGQPLRPENQVAIDSIIADQNPKRIVSFVNADFTDGEDMPSGLVSIYSSDSNVHPDSIPQEAFQHTVVCQLLDKVDGSEWTDADFAGREKTIQEAVRQFASNPPTLNNSHELTSEDDHYWQAELGSPDSFAGIFKKVHGGKARESDSTYYVVAQAGAPLVTKQLKQRLLQKGEEMTYKQLLEDPDFNQAHHVSMRNACRLAYNVARALKVPIRHMMDRHSFVENSYQSKPYKAIPNFAQPVSTIQALKGDVAVFHKVRPIKSAYNNCMVYSGPYDGIAMFSMKGNSNEIGLPASTGRSQSTVDASVKVDYKKRGRGLVWEGMEAKHPDLHPQAYRPIDDAFLEEMKKMGWRQDGTDNRHYMIPVLVKIYDDRVNRSKK